MAVESSSSGASSKEMVLHLQWNCILSESFICALPGQRLLLHRMDFYGAHLQQAVDNYITREDKCRWKYVVEEEEEVQII